jgi:hypothetical protein
VSGLSCTFEVKVVPGASRDEVAGRHGSAVKIRLRAPAVDGRANDALLDFLAARLGLPRRDITLLRGEKSRQKTIRIEGHSTAAAESALLGS